MQTSRNLITLPPLAVMLFNEFSDNDSSLSSRIESLKDELLDIQERVNEIQSIADSEGREFSAAEAREVETLFAQFEKTEQEIERREKILNQAKKLGQTRGRRSKPEDHGTSDFDARHMPANGLRSNQPGESVAMFKNLQTGETVRGYRGSAPVQPQNDLPVGDIVRGILLNDLDGLAPNICNSLSTGSDTGGGYLSSPALSGRVVDLARSASVTMRAGAVTIPMTGSELVLARVTGDPSMTWRAETQSVGTTEPTFGRFVLRPRMVSAIVPITIELLEDAPNAGVLIEQTLMQAMGAEIDRVLLAGSGASNEPLGVLNASGINTQSSVGALSNYSQITTAVRDILTANYAGEVSDLAWIRHPVTAATYDGLVTGISGDNTPLQAPEWASQLRRYHTTNLQPSGSPLNYSQIVGDFSQLLVGMRYGGVVFDVLDSGTIGDENAVSEFKRFVRCRMRLDCVVMQPGFFSSISGITV